MAAAAAVVTLVSFLQRARAPLTNCNTDSRADSFGAETRCKSAWTTGLAEFLFSRGKNTHREKTKRCFNETESHCPLRRRRRSGTALGRSSAHYYSRQTFWCWRISSQWQQQQRRCIRLSTTHDVDAPAAIHNTICTSDVVVPCCDFTLVPTAPEQQQHQQHQQQTMGPCSSLAWGLLFRSWTTRQQSLVHDVAWRQ
jgi:hypothetical protein